MKTREQILLPLPNDYPKTLAEAFLASIGHFEWKVVRDKFVYSPGPNPLRHWREEFYRFDDYVYRRWEREELEADVARFLNRQLIAVTRGKREIERPLRVTTKVVRETIAMMKHLTQIHGIEQPPAWIEPHEHAPPPSDIIAFENGLLDVKAYLDGVMTKPRPATPNWFSETVIPCRFAPKSTCPLWEECLHFWLSGDQELIGQLQEFSGYLLVPDTSLQVMLWLYGPSGTGKGTVGRMMRRMIGERNSVSFSLWDLVGRFTLSAFVGKTLAISADAHLGKDTDSLRVIEQLKAISGEDDRMIDRKNRELLPSIRLQTRFVIIVNDFPRLPDAGDTLRRRSIIIPFLNQLRERADRELEQKLVAELPGIVNWALQGLRRLRERGRFATTTRGQELQAELARQNSPVRQFLEECCTLADVPARDSDKPHLFVGKDRLYEAFLTWCASTREHVIPRNRFLQQIRQANPVIGDYRPRTGERPRMLANVALNAEWAGKVDEKDDEVKQEETRMALFETMNGHQVHPRSGLGPTPEVT